MSKVDVVSAAKLKFVADQDAAVQAYGEACYDGALADAPPSTGGGIDQSVVDGLNQQIADLTAKDAADAQAAIDAKAQGDAALAGMKTELDALSAKEGVEAQTLQNLSSAYGQLQQVVSVLAGLQPQPAPAPVDPAPVDPSV